MSDELQTNFIQTCIDGKADVTVFLINGVKLSGRLTAQGEATLELTRDGHSQLIYKHAVSTVMPVVHADGTVRQDTPKVTRVDLNLGLPAKDWRSS